MVVETGTIEKFYHKKTKRMRKKTNPSYKIEELNGNFC
jgi:hypothetical protein